MERDCYQKILHWKNTPHRKPLILRGARQVGKTYLLKQLGQQEFADCCYLNFEADPQLSLIFESELSPLRILADLSLYLNRPIHPQKTLIIFDEIQVCPRALTSLKYFYETAKDYFLVAAGSLLGVKLAKSTGFPVGKVNFIDLYPLSFFEFLSALGETALRAFLENITHIEPIATAVHLKLIELLRHYLFVGGMPEVVKQYAAENNLLAIREMQQEILQAYLLVFSKHADPHQIIKINKIWQAMPSQLAKENKKFQYAVIEKTAKAREYESALEWLVDAGLIHQAFQISVPRQPLLSYMDTKCFKLFLFDVGLLGALAYLPAKMLLQGDQLFTEFKGALTENFVAQELKTAGQSHLFYWTSHGIAEVDFLLAHENHILPLEVKSGTSAKQKSLRVYANKYQPQQRLRTSLMNLKQDQDMCNYPLYLVSRILELCYSS